MPVKNTSIILLVLIPLKQAYCTEGLKKSVKSCPLQV
jgi:hypothetical protein